MAWRRGTRVVRDGSHFKTKRAPDELKLDGLRFDSYGEKKRYAGLKLLQVAGHIKDLVVHPKLHMVINGQKIGRGFIILDFKYFEPGGEGWRLVYEDYKAVITREAKVRLQVCEAIHGIKIKLTKG